MKLKIRVTNRDSLRRFIWNYHKRWKRIVTEGELYIKDHFLASGYYNSEEKTKSTFVQNPLNKSFPEIVYKTGDLVKKREDGILLYQGRSDFQIKHMGYRIELGEIENKIYSIDEVNTCVTIYRDDLIILYYLGEISEARFN